MNHLGRLEGMKALDTLAEDACASGSWSSAVQ